MADTPPGPDIDDKPTTGTPRWVKVFGIVALALVVLFVAVKLIGGGAHGPGRHALGAGKTVSDNAARHAGPPPGITLQP